MLVLYETALGYCLFKVTDSVKIESADLWKEFETPEKASQLYISFSSAVTKMELIKTRHSQIKVESNPPVHINSRRC